MSNYIYLTLILTACLLAAIAILNEQLGSLDEKLQENFNKIERELNS